jgi:ATP phosphoribosyltransferase regulatory subunit
MVATRMRDVPLPLKLCYNESVLRYGTGRGKTREVIQAGVEYISEAPSPEIDAEVVVVAIEALKKAGLADFKVDLGDVGFVRAVMKSLGGALDAGDKKTKAAILKAVAVKDRPALDKLTKDLVKINDGAKELLLALPGFYGEQEVLKKARGFDLTIEAAAAIENLDSVVAIIGDKGYGDYITIDLGEVRGLDYYTGIIFEGFSSSLGSPILGGGRYDTLLGKYGYTAAATGFAFDVTSIVSIT